MKGKMKLSMAFAFVLALVIAFSFNVFPAASMDQGDVDLVTPASGAFINTSNSLNFTFFYLITIWIDGDVNQSVRIFTRKNKTRRE